MRRTVVTRVCEAVKAIALCHNVTPVRDDPGRDPVGSVSVPSFNSMARWYTDELLPCPAADATPSTPQNATVASKINYQASSPDEIALVTWTESVGLTLTDRNVSSMTLTEPFGTALHFTVLQVRPLFYWSGPKIVNT